MAEGALRFDDSAAYERFMGRWSRAAAPVFLDSIGETLVWRAFEPDSLKALFGRSPRIAPHEMRGELIVLTARSPEVRRVVADVARRPGFLSEADTWMRRRP